MANLADVVEQLASGDGPLRAASAKLRQATQSSNTGILPSSMTLYMNHRTRSDARDPDRTDPWSR